MKKKGNKKMPIPREEVIDNPIPTSLFISDNYVVVNGYTSDGIWGQKLKCVQDLLFKNKDVGMGLSMTSCLVIVIFLFPFFHEVTSLHPPSFQRNDFSTCFTYFFIWGKAPIKMRFMDSNLKGDYRTQVSYSLKRQSHTHARWVRG